MQFAEQAMINGRLGSEELARIAALETDAGFHLGFLHGCFDGLAILPGQSEWLFNDEVFAGFGRGHCLLRVVVGIRSEEHTSELQSLTNLVCRLLLEKKKR